MHAGQKVRLKETSPLGLQLKLPRGEQGAILCRYRMLRGESGRHRLDVRFGSGLVVWGAPDDQFEVLDSDDAVN